MKLVQFYLLTILTVRNSAPSGFGYLSPDDLEYLSKRLYPAECLYLTNALSENDLTTNFKPPKNPGSADDTLFNRPELHCLIKLEEWNEMALEDQRAHDSLEKILHKIGRFDLAKYLSEKLYSVDTLNSTENFIAE